NEAARVRPFHPREDGAQREALYDRFNENRTGSRIEERPHTRSWSGEPDPQALRFVYEQDGVVRGYLSAVEYPNEPSPFEAKVTTSDVAFDPEQPAALTALLAFTLREALRRGARRVTARLPFDPLVQSALAAAGLPYCLCESQSAIASNMLLPVDLRGLLDAI